MSRQIVAFAGSKGSGKTTAFLALKNNLENIHESMLANKLKKSVCEVYGFDFSKLDDITYKENQLDIPIELTRDSLIKVADHFGLDYSYDTHLRKHTGYTCDTLRHLLQYVGTEVLRGINNDIHIKSVVKDFPKEGLIVITDLRF